MALRGFMISCIFICFHETMVYSFDSNLCSQGCQTEHISCTVIQDADCSKISSLTSISWPSAPRVFHISERNYNGNRTYVLTWALPDDASFLKVTGFLLRGTLLQGIFDSVCVHIDLSSTTWLENDTAKEMVLPWDCTGMSRRKDYHITLNSLPLPSATNSIGNVIGLFGSVPERDGNSPSNWSPVIEVTQQNYTDKSGVNISVTFSLAPSKYNFRRYDVTIRGDGKLKVFRKRKRPEPARDHQEKYTLNFTDICEGRYKIEVQPYKKNDQGCTCVGAWPTCNPCLLTFVRIDVNPKIPCTQKPTTVNARAVTDNHIPDIDNGSNVSIAKPRPSGQTQALRNTADTVVIPMIAVGGVLVVLFLVLLIIVLWKCGIETKGKKPKKSTEENMRESNYGQEAYSVEGSFVSPHPSSECSDVDSDFMKQWNEDQSLAWKNNNHHPGNDTKCKVYEISNMGYAF